jgi:murein DD-endopeptidase MepM/ murein hydrolase activator NlpD
MLHGREMTMQGSAERPRRSVRRKTLGAGIALATLLAAAAHFDVLPLASSGSGAAALEPAPIVPAQIRWVPDDVVEGTLFTIIVSGGDPAVEAADGEFAGERLHFSASGDTALIALAAAPLDSAGVRELRIDVTLVDGRRTQQTAAIPVAAGEYRMERLSVAPQFGRPQPPEIQERMRREAARARAVSDASHATPRMWEPPILAPRESRITSGFGHGRMFNDEVQSRHTGTDFAGAVGAPVRAPARGVVALVDDFYLGGGVIYLDHGAGLVTAYLHLSAKDVAEGDVVERGDVIGRVGATGRVTGPHLHWIVRYGRHTVDGLSLLRYPDALAPAAAAR